MLILDAPGYGDQAATINVLRRLKEEWDFQGTVELIYDHSALRKIIHILGLPGSESLDNTYCCNDNNVKIKLRLLSLDQFLENAKKGTIPTLGLGFTGAPTNNYILFGEKVIPLGGIDWQKNLADLFHVKNFVRLTPYPLAADFAPLKQIDYNEISANDFFATHIWRRNSTHVNILRPLAKQFILYPVSSLQMTKEFIKKFPSQVPLKNIPALTTLIRMIEQENVNLFPLYGDGINNNVINLLMFILGARRLQLQGTGRLDNAITIAVFSDMSNELLITLNKLITRPNDELLPKSLVRSISDTGLNHIFQISRLNATSASKMLLKLQKNEILLLSMGNLPQIVFEGLFTFDRAFPPVREGVNTLNSLLPSGKPFFYCSLNSHSGHEPTFCHEYPELHALLLRLAWICVPRLIDSADYPADEDIAEFILQSQNPDSVLSVCFKQSSSNVLRHPNDKIALAFEEIAEWPDLLNESSIAFSNAYGYSLLISLIEKFAEELLDFLDYSPASADYLSSIINFAILIYLGAYFAAGINGLLVLAKFTGYLGTNSQRLINTLTMGANAMHDLSLMGVAKTGSAMAGGYLGHQTGVLLYHGSFWARQRIKDYYIAKKEGVVPTFLEQKKLKLA